MKDNFKLGGSLSVEELENRYEMSAFASADLLEEDCKKNCNTGDGSDNETGRANDNSGG